MTRPDPRTSLPRGHEPNTVDRGGAATIATAQARRAALVTVAHAAGPDDARELLAMLGLVNNPGRQSL